MLPFENTKPTNWCYNLIRRHNYEGFLKKFGIEKTEENKGLLSFLLWCLQCKAESRPTFEQLMQCRIIRDAERVADQDIIQEMTALYSGNTAPQ